MEKKQIKTAEEMFDNQTETFWDKGRQIYTIQKSDAISIAKEYGCQFKDRESPLVTENQATNYQPLYDLLKTHGLTDLVDCELDEIISCVKSLSPPVAGTVEEILQNVHDNSDGFRWFLKEKNIDYKPNGHFTTVIGDYDKFWLGVEFTKFRIAHDPDFVASTQSTTIERLTKALEALLECLEATYDVYTKDEYKEERDSAKELLESIKK